MCAKGGKRPQAAQGRSARNADQHGQRLLPSPPNACTKAAHKVRHTRRGKGGGAVAWPSLVLLARPARLTLRGASFGEARTVFCVVRGVPRPAPPPPRSTGHHMPLLRARASGAAWRPAVRSVPPPWPAAATYANSCGGSAAKVLPHACPGLGTRQHPPPSPSCPVHAHSRTAQAGGRARIP